MEHKLKIEVRDGNGDRSTITTRIACLIASHPASHEYGIRVSFGKIYRSDWWPLGNSYDEHSGEATAYNLGRVIGGHRKKAEESIKETTKQ